MERSYIDLDSDDIPVEFEVQLAEEEFTMGINYNDTFDFFTIDLFDIEGEEIVLGEKLILNEPLFATLTDDRIPGPTIIPMDESGRAKRISKENFYKTVFLMIDDTGDDNDEEG